jgi:hypothetical protein
MKTLVLITIVVMTTPVSWAQTRDSTKTKSHGVVVHNPNSRRNGYENYQNAADVTGVGLNPGATINAIDHRYEGLRGTPYFLPDWSKGQIEMVNGQHYTEVPIKFDEFRQHLIMLRPWAGGDSLIVNADQVKSFQLTDSNREVYLFRHLPTVKTDNEILKEGYFIVLADGPTTLLKRVDKKFKPADYKDPYSNGVRYDSFKEFATYYLLKPDQTLAKIKLSKKSLLDALGGHQDALKAFADKEKLSLGNEYDAAILVKQYNQL